MTDHYRGRFAPSPSGPLHFGSLISALVSYFHARKSGGQWLVRMEDIDPPREMSGAADIILKQLEAHGLYWDDEVLYQSSRTEAYLTALQTLQEQGLVYPCECSRQQLKEQGGIHRQPCQQNFADLQPEHALRVRVHSGTQITFDDVMLGKQYQNISDEVGDFVLRRKDGLFAYQLAVVVDDAYQNITHVIRGSDLLESTARQIYLQQLFGYPTTEYGHHNLALNAEGQKLSKQNLAPAIDTSKASVNLSSAMQWLGMDVPKELSGANCEQLLAWGLEAWG